MAIFNSYVKLPKGTPTPHPPTRQATSEPFFAALKLPAETRPEKLPRTARCLQRSTTETVFCFDGSKMSGGRWMGLQRIGSWGIRECVLHVFSMCFLWISEDHHRRNNPQLENHRSTLQVGSPKTRGWSCPTLRKWNEWDMMRYRTNMNQHDIVLCIHCRFFVFFSSLQWSWELGTWWSATRFVITFFESQFGNFMDILSGWWFETFFIFHNIWIILPID